jgi:hypothetical protein
VRLVALEFLFGHGRFLKMVRHASWGAASANSRHT